MNSYVYFSLKPAPIQQREMRRGTLPSELAIDRNGRLFTNGAAAFRGRMPALPIGLPDFGRDTLGVLVEQISHDPTRPSISVTYNLAHQNGSFPQASYFANSISHALRELDPKLADSLGGIPIEPVDSFRSLEDYSIVLNLPKEAASRLKEIAGAVGNAIANGLDMYQYRCWQRAWFSDSPPAFHGRVKTPFRETSPSGT